MRVVLRAAPLLVALSLLAPARALATPQFTSALGVGGGARTTSAQGFVGVFSMALRADVLFGARTPYAARVGPFVSLRSDAFEDLTAAAGVSVQVPVSEAFPIVVSLGGAVDFTASPARPAVLARLWWGTRSYNYHSPYGLAIGVWVEARRFFDDAQTTDVVGGVDIDLEVFALPIAFLVGWLRT